MAKEKGKGKRGFASMDPERQKEIAAMGGKKVSEIPGHMEKIGSQGGIVSGYNRRKGTRKTKEEMQKMVEP